MPPLHVLILAAGEGKRMRSQRSKLLHPCAGPPLITHAVRAACGLEPDTLHVVVAPGDDAMQAVLDGYPVGFAVQEEPIGTADAVARGIAAIDDVSGRLVVINGDCPGVRTSTLRFLLSSAADAAAAVLAVTPADRSGYGRLQRDDGGKLTAIVEEADATTEQNAAPEVNGGVYCFDLGALRAALENADTNNAQSEHYLTGVFAVLADSGVEVRAVSYDDADEVHGVNSRSELARAEGLLRRRALAHVMDGGVSVVDPATTYIDVDVGVGADTVLYPGVTLEGDTVVGSNCEIRSRARVTNSRLGDDVSVLDGTIIEESSVDSAAIIGPYARLRPGSDIGAGAKVGNFVETKATRMGAGSKASHLSYLGNARIGDDVNIGAGTITCNYDGTDKYETIIGDGAFIGSNTALVAPVRIGKNAYVGAGSTITEDVPAGALGLGRGRQVNKEKWAKKKDVS
jgi:bifunctional UDP-N-acetylglucosamine pyrophosphorylase/glucosamine-1-phosphate N-acetyltransferase